LQIQAVQRQLMGAGFSELAQNAGSLYCAQTSQQADLLRKTLLNCSIDAVSLYPTYRSSFDLIAKRG
jgi:hypothetical protein